MATIPRRLTKRDAGSLTWDGSGYPSANVDLLGSTDAATVDDTDAQATSLQGTLPLSLNYHDIEDPFGHGGSLG